VVGDSNNRSALAGVRALAEAGWEVGVGSQRAGGLAERSRWCSRRHDVPLADVGVEAFSAAVARATREAAYDLVFAVGDAEALTLSMCRDALAAPVAFPAHEVMRKVFDKVLVGERAEQVGVATPTTRPATVEAVEAADPPYVIKARQHWLGGGSGTRSRFDVTVTSSSAEAVQAAQRTQAAGAAPLLQEHVAGRLLAVVLVLGRDGQVLARAQQEAQAIWPTGRGVSVRARTVPVDEKLAAGLVALLRGLGWVGLVELQLLDAGDGPPRLIDVNGRFYGSLALAGAAGLNLPDLWGRVALGEEVEPLGDARPGVRYHWLEGDLRRLHEAGASLGGYLGAAAWMRAAAHGTWSSRDPAPTLRHTLELAGRLPGLRRSP